MSDDSPELPPGSTSEQPYFAPPPGYSQQSPSYLPPQQLYGQYPQQQSPYGPPGYYQPGPPGRKSHTTRNIILGVIGAFVLIIGVGTVAGLLIAGQQTSTGNTTKPTGSAARPAGPLSASTWYATDVKPTVNKLLGDYNRLRTDGNNNNDPAILADCQQMLTDVHAAQSEPPVADKTLESDWTKVLGDFSAGAGDCVGDLNNHDSSLGDRAKSEFLQANTDAEKLGSDLVNGS